LRPPSAAERTQSHTPFKDATRAASSAQAETPALRAAAPSEIELLRDARLALKQAPARALTLVEAHTRAYPAGKLTQERELIGISALVALGRRTAAGKQQTVVPWKQILTGPQMWLLAAMYACYGYSIGIYLQWFPKYLVDAHSYNQVNGMPFKAEQLATALKEAIDG
jgi:hypothetical protein